MKIARISRGGQIQIPAQVRRRWEAVEVIVEDLGDSLRIRPVPDDPIGAALGSFAGTPITSDEMATRFREEEIEAEQRKSGRG